MNRHLTCLGAFALICVSLPALAEGQGRLANTVVEFETIREEPPKRHAHAAGQIGTREWTTQSGVWGRIGPAPRARHRLPEHCRRRVSTNRGHRTAFAERCLERHGFRARQLPSACARRVETRRGLRTVYSSRCLSRAGFRVEARRDD